MSDDDILKIDAEINAIYDLVIPKYERGILEASVEKETALYNDLLPVFKKHGVMPHFKKLVKTDNQVHPDTKQVLLLVAGIQVSCDFLVKGADKYGVDGNYDNETAQRLQVLIDKREKLIKEEISNGEKS
jgi:hypothetical protein